MTDLNRLTNILVDVGDSVNDLLAENKRLRHVLTIIAEASGSAAKEWTGLHAYVPFEGVIPDPVAFATETASCAREALGNHRGQ